MCMIVPLNSIFKRLNNETNEITKETNSCSE